MRKQIGTVSSDSGHDYPCYTGPKELSLADGDSVYLVSTGPGLGYKLYYKGQYIASCDAHYGNLVPSTKRKKVVPRELEELPWPPKKAQESTPPQDPDTFWNNIDRDITATLEKEIEYDGSI